MLKTKPNLALYPPPSPVKIRGGIGEISLPIVEAYDRTSEIHLIAVHCVVVEHGGLIKKKERKEISCVNLKAFPTNKVSLGAAASVR